MLDPVLLKAVWHIISTFAIPILAFGMGVYISDALGLNAQHRRRNIYLMAIPVGLITVGVLLTGTAVQLDNGIVQYGHMQSVGFYLVFCGTIVFYGTLVPQIFNFQRRSMAPELPKDSAIEQDEVES